MPEPVTTRLDRAVIHAFRRLLKMDGRTITYQRGSNNSVIISAVVDSLDIDYIEANGLKMGRIYKQFAFLTGDLTFRGVGVEPQAGDYITTGGERYDLIKIGNERIFNYDESGGVITTVTGIKKS